MGNTTESVQAYHLTDYYNPDFTPNYKWLTGGRKVDYHAVVNALMSRHGKVGQLSEQLHMFDKGWRVAAGVGKYEGHIVFYGFNSGEHNPENAIVTLISTDTIDQRSLNVATGMQNHVIAASYEPTDFTDSSSPHRLLRAQLSVPFNDYVGQLIATVSHTDNPYDQLQGTGIHRYFAGDGIVHQEQGFVPTLTKPVSQDQPLLTYGLVTPRMVQDTSQVVHDRHHFMGVVYERRSIDERIPTFHQMEEMGYQITVNHRDLHLDHGGQVEGVPPFHASLPLVLR